MSTDATREDDTPATGDRSTEQAGADRAHQPAETLTREQYADAVRAGGGPISRDSTRETYADKVRADRLPETVTFENKDIEVTRNAADGIWIEGLPGDPPARIGDILTSPEESGRNRLENLRKEATKDADDLVDMGGKWTDLIRDTFGPPPPTHSMTNSRVPEMTATQPDHGINVGHGAEAFLTVAIVGAAAVHKLHERFERTWHH